MVIQTGDNKFGVAKWIVDPIAGLGTHTTYIAAMASASSGDTIFLRPGTYTGDVTLKAGVDTCAFDCDALTPNVKIIGKLTATFSGTASISGVQLQTNSSHFLAVTGNSATTINIKNCLLNCADSPGITYTSSSGSSAINIYDSFYGLTGNNTLFVSTSSGVITVNNLNPTTTSAGTTTASTVTTGGLNCTNFSAQFPITLTAFSGATFVNCQITVTDTTCLTTVTSGSITCRDCFFVSGTASAVSVGASTTVNLHECSISTTNTNGVTGAGTVSMTPIAWERSVGQIVNATTITDRAFGRVGSWTPVVAFGGASVGITYTSRTGDFTRIGNMVFFVINIVLSSKGSSTGAFTITLPSTPILPTRCTAFNNTAGGIALPAGTLDMWANCGTGGTLVLEAFGLSGFIGQLQNTNMSNTSNINVAGSYWTA